ncbi:ClbS/DfsB family four-helix bundle protein [Jonesia quinghaiensis]|uniref:ClbS/DfsB family four-helix bundle protein n=1 Tax=Jonesia quinghaiensis TaxID=262806 RepID=UPI00041FDA17|nr:ClbS/DfsB family four-helix bundle protein [Jonesia quinghaiensis]
MPRPTTKSQLLSAATEQYAALSSLIDAMSAEELHAEFLSEGRDRCVRDVLVHLIEWHHLLVNWIAANTDKGTTGKAEPFLPEPYTWKTYGDMNRALWKKHQSTPLNVAQSELEQSHKTVMAVVNDFTDEELFTKRFYPWTGTTSLGSYCVSATSSHYDWAAKILKKRHRVYSAGIW